MKRLFYKLFTIITFAGILVSCSEDALEPSLTQAKDFEGGQKTVEDVLGILYGGYNRMTSSAYYGRDFIIFGDVRSDNCYSDGNSGRFVADARMDYTSNFGGHWAQAYAVIASANIVIAIDPDDIIGDPDQVRHYQGQAYIMRALAHFDLLKYYGQMHNGDTDGLGVPYVEEYKGENQTPSRDTYADNKTKIYADLATAATLMDPAYDSDEKEQFTLMSAHALKSRVALYFKDWPECVTASLLVINSGDYSIVPGTDYKNSFLIDAAVNSIFELAYSSVDNNNINGLQQIYRGSAYGDVQGLPNLAAIFEPTDVRLVGMIGPDPEKPANRPNTNLGKYPSFDYSDNIPVLRYEEVILNYAEALWRIDDTDPDALDQLNLIPAQRNATGYVSINEDNILLERRKEFCFEGFRFHDLVRTGRDIPEPDPTLQTHDGPIYGTYKLAFPIPVSEIDANANIVQNNGY